MTRQKRSVYGVASRVQPFGEIPQRLRSIARAVEQQQLTAVRSLQRESLGSCGDTVRVNRKTVGVLTLDRSHDAEATEQTRSRRQGHGRKQNRGDHAYDLTDTRSIAAQ